MAFRSKLAPLNCTEDSKLRVIKDKEKARERTMNRAMRLLAAKPRSISEIRERLLEKAWTNAEIVNSVIEKLCDYKYLDDREFADSVALSKLRQKPQGKLRLRRTLYQKKLDKETIEQAVHSAFELMPESELIDAAINKRVRTHGVPQTREDKKKFYDHLLRQGFDLDLVRSKLELLTKETSDE